VLLSKAWHGLEKKVDIFYLGQVSEKCWDDFCQNQESAWFLHTTDWVKYCENSRFNVRSQNCSFVVMNDDKTTAIVPLLIEETSKDGVKIREFTFSGGPTPKYIIDSKIGRKLYNRIEGEIWHKINSIAKDQGVVKLWMRENVQNRCYLLSSTLKDVCDLNATDLAKSGFLDTSIYSSVLFLDQCENFLMSQMRKGHHAAIKKALKFLSVNYYDSDSISPEKMEQFRERYFYIAGKLTRPYKT